jgi:hypothetical protein
MTNIFDDEFKLFVRQRGYNIDSALFELEFPTPQHFTEYARAEKDQTMINIFQPLADVKYMSKRFLLMRYLGWDEDEVIQNEKMWREENPDAVEAIGAGEAGSASGGGAGGGGEAPGLDSMGIRGTDDMGGGPEGGEDLGGGPEGGSPGESPISGGEGGAPAGGDTAAPEGGL